MDEVYPHDGQKTPKPSGWRQFQGQERRHDELGERVWKLAESRKNGKDMQNIQTAVHELLYGALHDYSPGRNDLTNVESFGTPLRPTTTERREPSQVERLTGLSLDGSDRETGRMLRHSADTMGPKFMVELSDAMHADPAHAPTLLRAVMEGSLDADARGDKLTFARDPIAAPVLELYADITQQESAYQERRDELLGRLSQTPERPRAHHRARANLLLQLSLNLYREHGNDPSQRPTLERAIALIRQMLWKESERIRMLGDVLRSLPSSQWSAIDLEHLDLVDLASPVRCSDLEDGPLKHQIEANTRSSFPRLGQDFREFLKRDDAYLCYASCDGEVIASFGVEQNATGVLRIDWLCMNPRSDLKGLMEALVVSGVRQTERTLNPRGVYCVTKPHVQSHYIAIERMGTVGYGLTGKDEIGTYIRCRRMPEEAGAYIGKSLTEAEIHTLASDCPQPNLLTERTIKGRPCQVAKVVFHNTSPEQDRSDLGDEGVIYDWMEEGAGSRVLTRYVPLHERRDGYSDSQQTYLAIFEPCAIDRKVADAFDRDAGFSS